MSQNIPSELARIDEIENYLYDEVPPAKTGRNIHIAVLRQTESYNIFTTEGTELNLESTAATPAATDTVKRIVMFKRKQVAAERRTGKQKLRALAEQHGTTAINEPIAFGNFEEKTDDDSVELCRLHDNLCGYCVDCKLYGFANPEAAASKISRDSRIQTDSAFSLRGLERREDINLNAQSESIESEPSKALNSRAHSRPETYFPSIVTLYDVTWEEVFWVLYLLQETTRYGAETNRTGYVENDILGIWPDTTETISNLTLTKRTYAQLQDEDGEVGDIAAPEAREAMLAALPDRDGSGMLKASVGDSDGSLETLLTAVEDHFATDQQTIDHIESIHTAQTAGDD